MSQARDHEARTAEITDVDDFDANTIHQARLTVAEHAADAEDAILLMTMLGIHPSQENDPGYGTGPPPGHHAHRRLISTQPRIPHIQDTPLKTLTRTRGKGTT